MQPSPRADQHRCYAELLRQYQFTPKGKPTFRVLDNPSYQVCWMTLIPDTLQPDNLLPLAKATAEQFEIVVHEQLLRSDLNPFTKERFQESVAFFLKPFQTLGFPLSKNCEDCL